MAAFPDFQGRADTPFTVELEFKTVLSEFESGEIQAKSKRLFPRRNLRVRFAANSLTEAAEVWAFYLARKGRLQAFNAFLPWQDTYTGEYVATGDGEATSFNLPSKLATAYSVYVGGSEAASGVDFSITLQGGADGADRIDFTSPPGVGEYVTMDFTGHLKVHGRFAADVLSFEMFSGLLFNYGIEIKGELNR